MKKISLLIITLLVVLCFAGCNDNVEIKDDKIESGDNIFTSDGTGDVVESGNSVDNGQQEVGLETNDKYANVEQNPIVTMEMEDGGVVKIELYPQIAPTTVENFISLVEQGFYDGLTFHRLIPTFMAQGGDPLGNGTGGPGYNIKGEFSANNFKNDLSHEVGVISMARTSDMNGAGSQFFIVTHESSYEALDGLYAGFGKVTEGMDVVYNIVNTEKVRAAVDEEVEQAYVDAYWSLQLTGTLTAEQEAAFIEYNQQSTEASQPVVAPKIKKMTVETFGVDYDEPEKIAE